MASKIGKKLRFPYVIQVQYEHSTATDTHLLQYHYVLVPILSDNNRPRGRIIGEYQIGGYRQH